MTKEEYERLLKSDYWKGYSYSLIKERNFTCHDCGRSFPGERNKLQVHHLHYRDANPWSYDPSEVVVLCEECHKRRHGILPSVPPATKAPEYSQSVETDSYTRSFVTSYSISERDDQNEPISHTGRFYDAVEEESNWSKPLLLLALFFVIVASGVYLSQHKPKAKAVVPVAIEAPIVQEAPSAPAKAKPAASKKAAPAPAEREPMEKLERLEELVPAELQGLETKSQVSEPATLEPQSATAPALAREKTTLELLEERNHAHVVESAKRAGVSTEGTTSEILDRINHAHVVESAKRAGVSTEGTTSEILDRINHAHVVESAKRAGVSTEGTTSEILDRINHAHVVESAKRAGVSTEGTTSEILERITRKQMENW